MMTISQLSLYFLLAINVITLILFGVDKLKAKKHWWRIPEATLLIMAGISGTIGALSGMYLFHHKTMHKKFYIGVPSILLLQIGITIYILTRWRN